MSVFISLGIILLAMLIQGFLQFTPGVFAIFYHHALGKTSTKKADDQSLSFILGTEIATAAFFLTVYFIITYLTIENDFTANPTFLYIMTGVFALASIFSFFFYFRPGKKNKNTTKLFISRHLARSFAYHASHAKNRTDTILLGFISAAVELCFTLPLFVIMSIEILNLSPRFNFVFIIAYIIIATVPLFTIRTLYRTSHNLAEIERLRVKRKLLFRLVISVSFLLIAILTFVSGVNP